MARMMSFASQHHYADVHPTTLKSSTVAADTVKHKPASLPEDERKIWERHLLLVKGHENLCGSI